MNNLYSIAFLTIFLAGVVIGIKSLIRSRGIFLGVEAGIRAILVNSALVGVSVSFIAFGGFNFLSSITIGSNQIEIRALLINFAFFLIPGFAMFLGALWQYLVIEKYRDQFFKIKISRKKE